MRSFAIKIFLAVMAVASFSTMAAAQAKTINFDLHVIPAEVSCLSADGGPTPTAHVTVQRGSLNDTLTIEGNNFRPHLAFDMFTVQRSRLLANGNLDPNFTNFGLAWYQSDLQANALGHFKATIKTILLDQIFGFDPDAALSPLNTFHVGFWFNNPADANTNGCTFNVNTPTPFNGEHKAGPLAMISVPDRDTDLGPLCTNPNGNGTCNP
jgi:hypothetical protein